MKNVIVAILVAIVFPVLALPTLASASPGKIPSWAVAQETMADGTTWYAYAKAEIRQFKKIEVGQQIWLTGKSGIFQAEVVKILNPLAASNPRNPTRVWIEFKSEGQTESNLAVIFKKWGWPPN